MAEINLVGNRYKKIGIRKQKGLESKKSESFQDKYYALERQRNCLPVVQTEHSKYETEIVAKHEDLKSLLIVAREHWKYNIEISLSECFFIDFGTRQICISIPSANSTVKMIDLNSEKKWFLLEFEHYNIRWHFFCIYKKTDKKWYIGNTNSNLRKNFNINSRAALLLHFPVYDIEKLWFHYNYWYEKASPSLNAKINKKTRYEFESEMSVVYKGETWYKSKYSDIWKRNIASVFIWRPKVLVISQENLNKPNCY